MTPLVEARRPFLHDARKGAERGPARIQARSPSLNSPKQARRAFDDRLLRIGFRSGFCNAPTSGPPGDRGASGSNRRSPSPASIRTSRGRAPLCAAKLALGGAEGAWSIFASPLRSTRRSICLAGRAARAWASKRMWWPPSGRSSMIGWRSISGPPMCDLPPSVLPPDPGGAIGSASPMSRSGTRGLAHPRGPWGRPTRAPIIEGGSSGAPRRPQDLRVQLRSGARGALRHPLLLDIFGAGGREAASPAWTPPLPADCRIGCRRINLVLGPTRPPRHPRDVAGARSTWHASGPQAPRRQSAAPRRPRPPPYRPDGKCSNLCDLTSEGYLQ